GAVQEVAEENDVLRLRAIERAPEALHVLARGPRRKRNARAPEARRLAEMEIGHEKRALRGPVRGALGKEDEAFAGDLAGGHSRGNWVPACGGVTPVVPTGP